jgi:chemotaxis protein methyltransferase CheR
VLEKAKAGIFTQFEVQRGLPIQLLVKYFTQTGELWQLNADIRPWCSIASSICPGLFHLGSFDIIFCRNVLIYFDQDTRSTFWAHRKDARPVPACWRSARPDPSSASPARSSLSDRRGLYCLNTAPVARAGATPRVEAVASAAR